MSHTATPAHAYILRDGYADIFLREPYDEKLHKFCEWGSIPATPHRVGEGGCHSPGKNPRHGGGVRAGWASHPDA